MRVHFSKYQGTGNDFILIDDRTEILNGLTVEKIAWLCDRRFGIGADGLMLLRKKQGYDFEMVYYNSDGKTTSMCGNGGRCITAFAAKLGIIKKDAHFIAIDGEHIAKINDEWVSLKMNDVSTIEVGDDFFFLDTGSPHYVKNVSDVKKYNVVDEGRKVRNSSRFKEKGTNVNFIEKQNDTLFVRTYERGVENETYSCGTGVTAAALVASINGEATAEASCKIKTLGGELNIKFTRNKDNSFSNIWLEGPATYVFEGDIEI